MKQTILTIEENIPIAAGVYRMRLSGDAGDNRPGQFVNIRLEGLFLRRPISVCDCRNGELTLIYKTVGRGTELMSRLEPDTELDVLTGLGNGYDLSLAGDRPLLIGGGVGVPPLYMLARELTSHGKRAAVILGFNSSDDVFYEDEFRTLGCDVTVTTVNGSYGEKGFVTSVIPDDASYFYACGPLAMLRAVCRRTDIPGELSLEERMGCGFGACMGCTIETADGPRRVCKDGPVFKKEALKW